jgi:hypothetical protein
VKTPFPILTTLAALLLLLTLTACTTTARLTRPMTQATAALFTTATLSDLKLTGIKTGPVLPVQATPAESASSADPATLQAITQLRTQGPVGVLLPVTKVGETTPWWIFCPAGEQQARCESIPLNSRVTFSGQPLGHGMVLLPNRLTWTAR